MPQDVTFVLATSQTPPRAGRVLSETADHYEVQWHDGDKGRISKRASSLVRVRQDSLAELYAANPGTFGTSVRDDPVPAYTRALKDWPRNSQPTNPRLAELRGKVVEFGLSVDDLKALEKRVTAAFDKEPHIEKVKGGRWCWVERPAPAAEESQSMSLSEALKRLSQPETKKQPDDLRELRTVVQSYDLKAASESDQLTAWSLGLLKDPPQASPDALAGMPEPLLTRYLKATAGPPTTDEIVALAARPNPSRIADDFVAKQAAAQRPQLLLEALGFQRERANTPVAGATRIIDRFSRSWTGEVPDSVVDALLDLLQAHAMHAQPVGHAAERLLTPGRVPMDRLVQLIARRDAVPLIASLKGLPWSKGGLRRRVFAAMAQGTHSKVLSDRLAWMPIEMPDLVALCKEDATLRDALLSGDDSSSVAAQVVADWVPRTWTPGKIAEAIQWPASLLSFLPDRTLGSGLTEITTERPELARLLEDAPAAETARRIAEVTELSKVRTAELESQLDAARREAHDTEARFETERLERLHAEELLREMHRGTSDALAAQLRQAQVDVMMAVAAIIAELDAAVRAGSVDPNVHERAWLTASALGLEGIGISDGPIEFDPSLHQRRDGGTGGSVSVGTPGYTWNRDGERIVLRKALVTDF